MKKEEFTVIFSDKDQEAAVKEISLKIKSVFPKKRNYLIILFTPNYNPSSLLKTINFTITPNKILGLQSPFLIFDQQIINKGIVACCINKEGFTSKEAFIESPAEQEIEAFFSSFFKNTKKEEINIFSFLSPKISPSSYLQGLRQSLGSIFNLIGSGYTNVYSQYNYQILNSVLSEGMITLALKGINIDNFILSGYCPVGKPFTITKAAYDKNVIMEINSRPAINIYKHYFGEKFKDFMKYRLFNLYPLGIKNAGSFRLITVLDCLQDGSLVCIGKIKKGGQGHIMLIHPSLAAEELEEKINQIKNKEGGLAFVINSLMRKKILKEASLDEIKSIKKALGDDFKMIGIYSDYSLFSDLETGKINMEAGSILTTLWQ